MGASKIAITLDNEMVKELDMLVKANVFPNRSKAIQEAVVEKLTRMQKIRLAQECGKLDTAFEQALADEGIKSEWEEWPEY